MDNTSKAGKADVTFPMFQPIRPAGQELEACKAVYLLHQRGKTGGKERLAVRLEIKFVCELSHLQAKSDLGCTVTCSLAKAALVGWLFV